VQAIQNCLQRFCPEMEAKERQEFAFSFLPLIYGIYPYAAVTEKQRDAMEQAQVDFQYLSIYEISLLGAKKLLGV
ncbi:MAG: TetR/AcrR family transcriptional regulator, partial [Oscillospiraceae bacterium]|nr:TetR/AcrR family transcriptional regulator [Oscillospiraceae bacterium]